MTIEEPRIAVQSILDQVCNNRLTYVKRSVDFTRNSSLSLKDDLLFALAHGAGSTKMDLDEFTRTRDDPPCESTLKKSLDKIKPEACRDIFTSFVEWLSQRKKELLPSSYASLPAEVESEIDRLERHPGLLPGRYEPMAGDGSKFPFPSDSRFASSDYIAPNAYDKPVYMVHVNALYDLLSRTYVSARFQPYMKMDEQQAICEMVDAWSASREDAKGLFILDRNYEAYNVMAHIIEKGAYFLIRGRDIGKGGILQGIELPDAKEWDINVTFCLTFSKSRKIQAQPGHILRRIRRGSTRFDFLASVNENPQDVYTLRLRIARVRLSDGHYEILITNVPERDYGKKGLKWLYGLRWGEEISFRSLKYSSGAIHLHSKKPEAVEEEILLDMTAYNMTECMMHAAVQEIAAETEATQRKQRKPKAFVYTANFAECVLLSREFLLSTRSKANVLAIIKRDMVPVRDDRIFPRNLQKRKSMLSPFVYRAS